MKIFIIIFGTILSVPGCICRHHDVLDSLDINDVFPKLPHYYKANETIANKYKDSVLDMSKVSEIELNKTILNIHSIYENVTGLNASIVEDVEEQHWKDKKIELLRKTKLLNDTRRHELAWHGPTDYVWDYASTYIARQKMLDCMLTLIYMARHHLKEMSEKEVFRPKDNSYRIAYLWSRLEKLYDRIFAIYNTMAQKAYTYGWDLEWDRPYYFLMLHQRALKVHTQFNFYFWIIAKMHQRFMEMNQIYVTTPTTSSSKNPPKPPNPPQPPKGKG